MATGLKGGWSLLAALAATLLMLSCSGGSSPAIPPQAQGLVGGLGIESTEVDYLLTQGPQPSPLSLFASDPYFPVKQTLVEMINNARRAEGLGEITLDWAYSQVAQSHADDMAARNFFAHVNPDGLDPVDRVVRFGLPVASYAGENIAAGFSDLSTLMLAWLNSPGHRRNIMQRGIVAVGVGVAKAPPGHDFAGSYIFVNDFRAQ